LRLPICGCPIKTSDLVVGNYETRSSVEPWKTLRVTLINATAYSHASKLEGSKMFSTLGLTPEVTSQSQPPRNHIDMNMSLKDTTTLQICSANQKLAKLAEH